MTRLNDPACVRAEYASEKGLEGRRAAYRFAEGPDPVAIAFEAVAEARPRRVLEVGCGPGELSERIRDDLSADVVALDISPRMVELARERGLAAHLGDVQDLPFGDGEFDCAVAAWMLYHVRDGERALAELRRVLRPGGRLVAVTNHPDHLRELRQLTGVGPRVASLFSGENASELLARHFSRVEERDASGTIRFPDRESVLAFVRASATLLGGQTPPPFETPLVVRRRPVVFVARTGE
ncbi:MAG: class I SAM-dependent methyltransferase [Actinomycetota bacterium]|nr:class I SAM-dependent methyltransferase [Actinomycetota bacterium]